ncbi:hypothetical protein F4561_006373 [Lipingzhangella halophila]|uniref:Uncharacterized protein n=1 Tax=Lipingzhangella halophila TaxID=1783352 RepID=A0A7W7RNY3_9ACTN|nr:DoxX family protein [Lipingzhangella halophila]MBB4935479.1 hypothetical protein [Lipingzhangella halophila]
MIGRGLLGAPAIGIAAATGFAVFYVGVVITHIRARVLYNLYFPGTFLALAIGALTVALAR